MLCKTFLNVLLKDGFISMHYLIDEQPLSVLPSLVRKLDMNSAIILQYIHFGIRKKENDAKEQLIDNPDYVSLNFKEGKYWVYNTIHNWHKKFNFISKSSVIRAFTKLKNLQLLEVDNHNANKNNQTLWYTIDYKEFESFLNKEYKTLTNQPVLQNDEMHSVKMSKSTSSNCSNGVRQIE